MFKIVRKEIQWGGRKLILETGKLARQADGAVLATYGETSVLTTVVMNRNVADGATYFPLNVHYKEMFFAAGKIPGGFRKREGAPSEKEIITSRLIDRPIRPLFPDGFFHEVQIISTVLSYDGENNPDVVALISASAALAISGVPFAGHIGAARVGRINGELTLNPTQQECEVSELDLVVAGTKDSILMVEAGIKELSEEDVLKAISYAQSCFSPVIDMIDELKSDCATPILPVQMISFDNDLVAQIKSLAHNDLVSMLQVAHKRTRQEQLGALKDKLFEAIDIEKHSKDTIRAIVKSMEEAIMRDNIFAGVRIDGRDSKTIRPIATEVSILPRVHGSALFTRGSTQALVVSTLGSSQDEQIIDSLERDGKERFLLHYNFPHYSVGETGPVRGPGRREIGHGKLAWKAISAVLPTKEEFAYTIRVVSEITECNGSSSMATVCGTTLSLMDAGVPIKNPVAGIAMGLIKGAGQSKEFVVLTDIIGDEDNLGDMDFKVARTQTGITALQMYIKVPGITIEIMEAALAQAKEGLQFILGKLSESIIEPRQTVSQYAPSITKIKINKEKIGALIGPGGKMIKEICEKSGAKIDIDDTGVVSVAAVGKEAADIAIRMINNIVAELEIGRVYEGLVKQVLDFGAVVSVLNKEGLVHISELAAEKVDNIHDVIKVNDVISVKVLHVDPHKGKIRLSIKAVNEPEREMASARPPQKHHKPRPQQQQHTQLPKTSDEVSEDSEEEEVNYNRADKGSNADIAGAQKPRHEGSHRSGAKRFFNKDRNGQQNKPVTKRKKYFTT